MNARLAPVQLFKLFTATTPAGGTVRSFALQLSRSCLSSRVPRLHAFRRNLCFPFIFVISTSSHSHARRGFLAAEFFSSRSLRARLATIVVRSWCDRNKMAAAAAAALLDELMGRNRNVLPNEKPKELNWEDPEFCKLYLVKFCPHDLFVNTRADLGACPKVHDDEARELFEKAPYSYRKQQYEDEFIRYCQSMLNEVERKIIKGKQRLALIGRTEAPTLTPAQTQRNEEQIALLTEKINKLVEEAEQSGIRGNVEEAQGLMRLCDQLKDERETLRKSNDNSHYNQTAELAAAQEKQMEVCDVCGAFLIVGDAQQRIDDHLMGKQHVGYARLKSALQEIMNKREKARDEKEQRREEERKQRARANEELDRRRRDGDRDRDRDRDRDKRRSRRMDDDKNRHDSSSHRNSGHRSRSRSRERHHRDEDNYRRHSRDKGNRDHRSSSHQNRRRHRSRSRSHK